MDGRFPERIAIVLISATLSACAAYSAKPISAIVVNAETGRPLKDVNVVVTWELEYVPMGFGYSEHRGGGLMAQMEAVTDGTGRFHAPGWGPTPIPSDLPARSMLNPMQPSIRLFKSGYRTHIVSNSWQGGYLSDPFYKGPAERGSEWNGKAIRLTPLPERIADHDWRLLVNPNFSASMISHCNWRTMPRYLSSLIKERERIAKQSSRASVSHLPQIDDVEQWGGAERCGSVKRFLEDSKLVSLKGGE